MRRSAPTTQFRISHFAKSKQSLAAKYDSDDKGFLTEDELGQLYAKEAPAADGFEPDNLEEALQFLGVQSDVLRAYVEDWTPIYNYQAATDWRGNFHIPGAGAGNVKTGRRHEGGGELFVFNFILDLFSTDYLIENLEDPFLIVAPSGFSGPSQTRPLTYVSRTKVRSFSRFGPFYTIYPNQLQFQTSLSSMVALAGSSGGLSFFARIELGGSVHYVNRDGVPFRNFDIPVTDLAASGSP